MLAVSKRRERMKRVYKFNPIAGVVLVVFLTTALTLYGLKILKDRDAADAWVNHTHTVIDNMDLAQLGLVNMETGFRGYLLTGRKAFLDPYNNGKIQYETAMQNLMDLTDDNSSQKIRWKQIETLIGEWQDEWVTKGIQIRKDVEAGKSSNEVVLDYALTEGGKQRTDAIRALLSEGFQEEQGLLAERVQAGQRANAMAYEVMLGGMILAVILGLSTGLLLALSAQRSREHIALQHMLLEEREKERMEIARNLHDGPVQDLVAATFVLQGMASDAYDEQTAAGFEMARSSVQKVISDLRAYAMQLRSPVLVQFGLEKAIQSHLEAFQPEHPDLRVRFTARQTGDLLSPASRDGLFRIYQESLNNIVRHAQASEVRILFEKQDGKAVLEIRDNGVGFEPVNDWLALARQGHLGLVGIRERADMLGGQIEIISHPGAGTCLRVIVPA
jgi:signal transduction histidine kinase